MYSQNNQTNTAVMECTQFILPTAMGLDAPSDDLSEDMEGLRLTFPKVKIPGGGVLQFEMESDNPERPDYVPELEGILLFNHPANAYWPEGEEYEDNTPPLCQSVDGKIGYLRAVKRYLTEPRLRRYQFSTVAWHAMRQSITSFHRAEERRRETERKYLKTLPARPPDPFEELEAKLLLHDLAAVSSQEQYALASMRLQGYSIAETACNAVHGLVAQAVILNHTQTDFRQILEH